MGDELALKADPDPPDNKALLSKALLSQSLDDSPSKQIPLLSGIRCIDLSRMLTVVEPARNLFLSHVIV